MINSDASGQRVTEGRLTFLDETSERVYRWAIYLGLSASDAEDAAQEIVEISVRRESQCPNAEAKVAWLFQIARRVVANRRRRNWFRWRVQTSVQRDAAFVHQSTDDLEREWVVRSCLRSVELKQREVLVLMDIEGHTREEVASMLQISPGTVASRLRLGREAFRKQWEGLR